MTRLRFAPILMRAIVGIVLVCSSYVARASVLFSGEWKYVEHLDTSEKPYSTFDISLTEREDGQLRGSYCFVTQNGNRIDCDPVGKAINITGHVAPDGKSAEVNFYSFFGAKDGVAELSRIGSDLTWRVTKKPSGDFFYGPFKVQLQKAPEDKRRGERQVVAAKAYLYGSPSASLAAKTYVVKGDYVGLLNVSDDFKFWKVKYMRSDGIVIKRWIDCNAIAYCP